MLPQWIIEKKRDGISLSDEEIRQFIAEYVDGSIPDYQMSALAMAIYLRGMTPAEISALTMAMMNSGNCIQTDAIKTPKMDKHSTGGIGDKISLILAPLAASCGIAVPMISGRGLGITGGTLDKLESIPGYRTVIPEKEFLRIVAECGCSIMGQTESLVPADRKLYALRDVTGTVPSIPLIVSSIMSKKLAAGLDGLVLDVKCGNGAFMKNVEDANALANALVTVGRAAGKKVGAMITDMNQPLGRTVGNTLEVIESIETLRGDGPADVTRLTLELCAYMLVLCGKVSTQSNAMAELQRNLNTGKALEIFSRMIRLHGGDPSVVDNPRRFGKSSQIIPIPATSTGFVHKADAGTIGRACMLLGAGRARVTDSIDCTVGISGIVKIGEPINKGEPLAMVHANRNIQANDAIAMATSAFVIGPDKVEPPCMILASI